MSGFLPTLLYGALVLGVLVFVHELGHFLVAEWLGVRVLSFSIGMGPRLFGFRAGETDYRISLLPLGGFVRMAVLLAGSIAILAIAVVGGGWVRAGVLLFVAISFVVATAWIGYRWWRVRRARASRRRAASDPGPS